MAGELLRSVASRLRGGGARSGSGPAGFFTPPPSSNEIQQRRGYGFVVGMAAGAALRSLASQLARAPPATPHSLLPERALNSLGSPKPFASGSSSPSSKLNFSTSLATTTAGVALFGSLVCMYGWVMPRLESKFKARKLNDDLTKTIQAVEHLLQDVSAHVSEGGQSSGLGKKPDGGTGNSTNAGKLKSVEQPHDPTGNSTSIDKVKSVEMEAQCHSKDLEAPTDPHSNFTTNYNKLMAEIAKLKLSLQMETQCHSKYLEAPTDPHSKFTTNYNNLMAEIAKLKLSLQMETQCHSKDLEAPTDPHSKFTTDFNNLMADIAKLKLSLESS